MVEAVLPFTFRLLGAGWLICTLAACGTSTSHLTAKELKPTIARMHIAYQCAWYFELANNEASSIEQIDVAVLLGENAGLTPQELFSVYYEARAAQKKLVERHASSSLKPRINDAAQTFLSEESRSAALIELFKDQCEEN